MIKRVSLVNTSWFRLTWPILNHDNDDSNSWRKWSPHLCRHNTLSWRSWRDSRITSNYHELHRWITCHREMEKAMSVIHQVDAAPWQPHQPHQLQVQHSPAKTHSKDLLKNNLIGKNTFELVEMFVELEGCKKAAHAVLRSKLSWRVWVDIAKEWDALLEKLRLTKK